MSRPRSARRPRRPRRGVRPALLVLAVGLLSLDVGFAAQVVTTGSVGNGISTAAAPLPPTNVRADLSVAFPGISCNAVITWDASATPGVTTYQVERIIASTGNNSAGPWTVTGLSYSDNGVPLALLVNAYAWRVRAVHDGFHSAWVTATTDTLLNCVL